MNKLSSYFVMLVFTQTTDAITRSLILALGVCYHACLRTREAYRRTIAPHFRPPCALMGGEKQILDEIETYVKCRFGCIM